MKRKLLALFITLSVIFLLVSCKNEYPPVESTEEERATVMTLSLGDKKYDVPYELYRAFFLQFKGEIDGGDNSVWTGEKKNEYITKIDKKIIEQISDIYAIFHIADSLGIDVYSKENEKTLDEYIKASVEGGYVDELYFAGFDGNYDAYLASLKEMHLNYSVQRMLLRYSLATTLIEYHYKGDSEFTGALKYTRDDVKRFYDSDDSARFIKAYFSYENEAVTDELLNRVHEKLAAAESETDAALIVINSTIAVGSEVLAGEIIGTHSLDPMYYSDLTDAAFSLDIGEVSDIIKIATGFDDSYYILYKASKSDEHFEENYSYIQTVYEDQLIGEEIFETKNALIKSVKYTDKLSTLDRSKITMG